MQSIVGPVIEVQIENQIKHLLSIKVYDALILLKLSTHLTDSTRLTNSACAKTAHFLSQLTSSDSISVGLTHLIPAQLNRMNLMLSTSSSSLSKSIPVNHCSSMLLMVKSYSNSLVCEVSHLCYEGLCRTLALSQQSS